MRFRFVWPGPDDDGGRGRGGRPALQVCPGDPRANTTDATDGDASPCPAIHLDGGPEAVEEVLAARSAAGSERSVPTDPCVTGQGGTGLANGPVRFVRQNPQARRPRARAI